MSIDTYFTPDWAVRQCIEDVVPFVCPVARTILEPGAGQGAFVKRLRERYPESNITAVDVDPYDWPEADVSIHRDFLTTRFDQRFDLTIGNPPFSIALEFINHALSCSKAVVFLLRQGFLSSQKRSAFFRMHRPSDVYIMANRPQFTDEGSDKADYCFVCWGRPAFNGSTNLHWLPTVPLPRRRPQRPDTATR